MGGENFYELEANATHSHRSSSGGLLGDQVLHVFKAPGHLIEAALPVPALILLPAWAFVFIIRHYGWRTDIAQIIRVGGWKSITALYRYIEGVAVNAWDDQ